MKVLTTQTIITNTIHVEDHLVEGMSDDEIVATLEQDPTYFGRDEQPHIEADLFVSIEDD